jgi:hypothetical protein
MPLPLVAAAGAANAIGSLAGALGFGKKKKSACRVVSSGDVNAFRTGGAAPWIVGERRTDLKKAYGMETLNDDDFERATGLTFLEIANIHMQEFVPLCQGIEAGNFTDDPNAGTGLAYYTQARDQFIRNRAALRQTQVAAYEGPTQSGQPLGTVLAAAQAAIATGATGGTQQAKSNAPLIIAGAALVVAALIFTRKG